MAAGASDTTDGRGRHDRRMSPLPRTALAAIVCLAAAFGGGCGGGGSSSEKPPPKGPPAIPAQGVYGYRTSGFERLTAFVASSHRYPRNSTIAVDHSGCGLVEHWEPRPERSSESRFCVEGRRWRLAELVDYHEFFGQPVTQRFRCTGPLVPRPPYVRQGFRWTDRCRGAGSRVTVRYEAVRTEAVAVAGRRVETVVVRARATLRGRIDGFNDITSWLARRDGLLVRRVVRSRTALDSPFGTLKNSERYALQLRSPSPR
jgi:hypothetical protein